MFSPNTNLCAKSLKRFLSSFVLVLFTINTVIPPQMANAQFQGGVLPAVGSMVTKSSEFSPSILKGVIVNPNNPLAFDFIVDRGENKLQGQALKDESTKLIKYFLASLTVPEKDLWVNLSPYEKGRIVAKEFGQTEMGRDLLAQDYILKQLTASLIYPESDLGKEFWGKVRAKVQAQYGTTNLPVNTFNKVWIVPSKAVVYEHNGGAFVVESHLKVMLEEDYLSLQKNSNLSAASVAGAEKNKTNTIGSEVIRSVLIPQIEEEVNTGKNFANLRQIYNSMILAVWYKKTLRESLLGKIYMDQNKIKGVDLADKQDKEKIYQQYLQSFKKGAYNYIKEEIDPVTKQVTPRKYFSGGMKGIDPAMVIVQKNPSQLPANAGNFLPNANDAKITAVLGETVVTADAAMKVSLQDLPSKLPAFIKRAQKSTQEKVQVFVYGIPVTVDNENDLDGVMFKVQTLTRGATEFNVEQAGGKVVIGRSDAAMIEMAKRIVTGAVMTATVLGVGYIVVFTPNYDEQKVIVKTTKKNEAQQFLKEFSPKVESWRNKVKEFESSLEQAKNTLSPDILSQSAIRLKEQKVFLERADNIIALVKGLIVQIDNSLEPTEGWSFSLGKHINDILEKANSLKVEIEKSAKAQGLDPAMIIQAVEQGVLNKGSFKGLKLEGALNEEQTVGKLSAIDDAGSKAIFDFFVQEKLLNLDGSFNNFDDQSWKALRSKMNESLARFSLFFNPIWDLVVTAYRAHHGEPVVVGADGDLAGVDDEAMFATPIDSVREALVAKEFFAKLFLQQRNAIPAILKRIGFSVNQSGNDFNIQLGSQLLLRVNEKGVYTPSTIPQTGLYFINTGNGYDYLLKVRDSFILIYPSGSAEELTQADLEARGTQFVVQSGVVGHWGRGDRAMNVDMTKFTVNPRWANQVAQYTGEGKVVNGRTTQLMAILTQKYAGRFEEIRKARLAKQEAVDQGKDEFKFLDPNAVIEDAYGNKLTVKEIRDGDWKVDPLPERLTRPGAILTGPWSDEKWAINSLSSGAVRLFRDQEDAGWHKGVASLKSEQVTMDITSGKTTSYQGAKRVYTVPERSKWPVITSRVRGMHFDSKFFSYEGVSVPAMIEDMVLFALNNPGINIDFVIPKTQSWQEIKLVTEIMMDVERFQGLPRGSYRFVLMLETIEQVLQLEEVLWTARHHVALSNIGRWDKMATDVRIKSGKKEGIYPDPQTVTMRSPANIAYAERNVSISLKRGAEPEGGMFVLMKSRDGSNPDTDKWVSENLIADKTLEADQGYKFAWVATPQNVVEINQLFQSRDWSKRTPKPYDYSNESLATLLELPKGQVTSKGYRRGYYDMLAYFIGYRTSGGAVAIIDERKKGARQMQDLAIGKINTYWLWELNHYEKQFDDTGEFAGSERARREIEEVATYIQNMPDADKFSAEDWDVVKEAVYQLTTSPKLPWWESIVMNAVLDETDPKVIRQILKDVMQDPNKVPHVDAAMTGMSTFLSRSLRIEIPRTMTPRQLGAELNIEWHRVLVNDQPAKVADEPISGHSVDINTSGLAPKIVRSIQNWSKDTDEAMAVIKTPLQRVQAVTNSGYLNRTKGNFPWIDAEIAALINEEVPQGASDLQNELSQKLREGWAAVHGTDEYLISGGVMDGPSAAAAAEAGAKFIYLSGWQASHHWAQPDLAKYPLDTVPNVIEKIYKFLENKADQQQIQLNKIAGKLNGIFEKFYAQLRDAKPEAYQALKKTYVKELIKAAKTDTDIYVNAVRSEADEYFATLFNRLLDEVFANKNAYFGNANSQDKRNETAEAARLLLKKSMVDYRIPVFADGDAGHQSVGELVRLFIKANAAAIHLEDQLHGEKKCGHMSGKVLVSIREHYKRLLEAQSTALRMGSLISIIARTDAQAAKLLASNEDARDHFAIKGTTKKIPSLAYIIRLSRREVDEFDGRANNDGIIEEMKAAMPGINEEEIRKILSSKSPEDLVNELRAEYPQFASLIEQIWQARGQVNGQRLEPNAALYLEGGQGLNLYVQDVWANAQAISFGELGIKLDTVLEYKGQKMTVQEIINRKPKGIDQELKLMEELTNQWDKAADLKTYRNAVADEIKATKENGETIARLWMKATDPLINTLSLDQMKALANSYGISINWSWEPARTYEGFYQIDSKIGSITAAVRSRVFARIATSVWMEQEKPNSKEGGKYIADVNADPKANGVYHSMNISPSFNWSNPESWSHVLNKDEITMVKELQAHKDFDIRNQASWGVLGKAHQAALQKMINAINSFSDDMGKAGNDLQFVTIFQDHTSSRAMAESFKKLLANGAGGFVRQVQQEEQAAKDRFVTHQKAAGVPRVEATEEIMARGSSATGAGGKASTERGFGGAKDEDHAMTNVSQATAEKQVQLLFKKEIFNDEILARIGRSLSDKEKQEAQRYLVELFQKLPTIKAWENIPGTEILRSVILTNGESPNVFRMQDASIVALAKAVLIHLGIKKVVKPVDEVASISRQIQKENSPFVSSGDVDGDDAMNAKKADPLGGINLDPTLMNLQIKRDGRGIPLPLSQQPIGSMKIDGFMPIIIKIQPVENVPLLLGFAPKPTKKGATQLAYHSKSLGKEPEAVLALN